MRRKIIEKPIGASKFYDKLRIEETLSNLKDNQQDGLKEGGSTNKYFTGITGSLPGDYGQVFNPKKSGVKGESGKRNSDTYHENFGAIQKPLGASTFSSSKFIKNTFPPDLDIAIGINPEDLGLGGGLQYALQSGVSYNIPDRSEVQKPLGASNIYRKQWGDIESLPNQITPIPISVPSTNLNVSSSTPNPRPTNWQYQITPSTVSTNTNYATYTDKQLKNASNDQRVGSDIANQKGIIDFRKNLRGNSYFTNVKNPNLFPEPDINYGFGSLKKLETRVNLGDPGNPQGKDLRSYTKFASPNSFDIINASAIYQSEGAKYSGENNDLVKFVIGSMDGTNPNTQVFMHFRAFLGSISDNYTGNWDSVNYVGRGENFYNYTGFDRKVSLSFTVAAQSKAELAPMYRKLNFLASNLAPDYSEFGYMRGPLVTLTVGGYFYNQPGFITGLTYEMSEETPWEIGIGDDGEFDSSVKELTHIIKVSSFAFTPIHTFPVRKQVNNYGGIGGKVTEENGYGKERYIALKAGSNDLYGKPYSSPIPDANNNTPDPTKIKTNPPIGTVPQDKSTMILATPTYGATPVSNAQGGGNTQGGAGITGNTGADVIPPNFWLQP
jgi:hypothetical protein